MTRCIPSLLVATNLPLNTRVLCDVKVGYMNNQSSRYELLQIDWERCNLIGFRPGDK
jgi:hypothetical protein